MSVELTPMTISFDTGRVEELRRRLRGSPRRPPRSEAVTTWPRGVSPSWLAELLADWREFDVAAFEARLAELDHRWAWFGNRRAHVVVATGRGPDPLPLLLCNGWPSTFCEFLDVLPLLTRSGSRTDATSRAFTVVMPGLPGFGFSDPPPPTA